MAHRILKKGISRPSLRGIVGCLLCVACLTGLCGCGTDSLASVKRELKRRLSVSFRYLREDRDGKAGTTYHFTDENGIPFSFTSEVSDFHMDGQTFFSYKDNTCNYPAAFFAFHLPEMERIGRDLGLASTAATDASPVALHVSLTAYGQVGPAADLVHALLTRYTLPLKPDPHLFSLPEIQIRDADQFNCTFAFPCEGTPVPTREEIHQTILSGYVTDCKNGYLPNDLPEELRRALPPEHMDAVRFRTGGRERTLPVSFAYEESTRTYTLALYDLRDSNTEYFSGGALQDMLALLGYDWRYQDGFLHYEIHGTAYDFALSDNHEEMIVYRDNMEAERFPVLYEDGTSQSVIAAAPADMIARMLDLSVTVDMVQADILFHDD